MPMTSALGRLTHREHKACKSEGFLKAASHLMLKNYLSQKQKPSFAIKLWYFLILKRLRTEQLWTLEVHFLPVVTLLAFPAPFQSVEILISALRSCSAPCAPTYIKTCIYQLWPSHRPENPPDQAVSCHMPRTFISLVPAVFGVCEGVSPKQWLPSPQPHLSCSVPLTALQQMNEPPRTFGDLK